MGDRDAIKAALDEHERQFRPQMGDSACSCGGWVGPQTQLQPDDSRSHRAHLADVLAALIPEGQVCMEWQTAPAKYPHDTTDLTFASSGVAGVHYARCEPAYVPREAIARMFDEAPRDWWQFVPCGSCNVKRQEPCVQGGASWPAPAWQPHEARRRSGQVLHGTLWLLANGFEGDVLGGVSDEPGEDA